MGVNKKTDGRYIVGMGAPNENEYKGSQGWRDIFIQLTENGATPDSEEKLAFLRDYAIYHNGEGNAIMPPSVSVWVSNNGVTSAVNADDISLDGNTYTICGIKWDGSSWDYTNAGQSSGGGGSSLPSFTSSDVGKVLTVESVETGQATQIVIPEQTVTTVDGEVEIPNIGTIESLDTDATMTVNGTALQATYNSSPAAWVATSGDYEYALTYITKGGERVVFSVWDTVNDTGVDGTFTVMLSATVTNYELAADWASPIMLVSAEHDGVQAYTLNKSYEEIASAPIAVVVNSDGNKGLVLGCFNLTGTYAVVVNGAIDGKSENIAFTASLPDAVLTYISPK